MELRRDSQPSPDGPHPHSWHSLALSVFCRFWFKKNCLYRCWTNRSLGRITVFGSARGCLPHAPCSVLDLDPSSPFPGRLGELRDMGTFITQEIQGLRWVKPSPADIWICSRPSSSDSPHATFFLLLKLLCAVHCHQMFPTAGAASQPKHP